MNHQQSKAPMGLGIVNCILGSLAMVYALVQCFLELRKAGLVAAGDLALGLGVELWTFVLGLMLLMAGVGLFGYKGWGRTLSLVWAVLTLLTCIGAVIYMVIRYDELRLIGLTVSRILQFVLIFFGLVYAIVLLVLLNVRRVVAALASGGVRPTVYAGPPRPLTPPVAQALQPATVPAAPAKATVVPGMLPGPRVTVQQIGGSRHGDVKALTLRDATGRPRPNIIGRDPDCDVVVTRDPGVSGKHCEISEDENGYLYAFDLNSTAGTYLIKGNAMPRRVKGRVYLDDGDVIQVSGVQFQVRTAKAPDPWMRHM